MNLYRIMRSNFSGYDIYIGAIVAANDEDDARQIHPSGRSVEWDEWDEWIKPEYVQVEYIGTTEFPRGVILASYKAG